MKTLPFLMTMVVTAATVNFAMGDVPVIPRPVKEIVDNTQKKGCVLTSDAQITAPPALLNESAILKEYLSSLPSSGELKQKAAIITLKEDASLPKEGYTLKITPESITVTGGSSAGVFYGIQSLNQMRIVLADQWKKANPDSKMAVVQLPAVTLEDAPACEWRGAMMDSARHFQKKEFVKKFIDSMAMYKLNRMHWHLVDSEGWRLEIKKYPKLTEVCKDYPAEYPGEDPTDRSRPAQFAYGHFHGGGYFTQDDIREIVAYAKARHIEIMPEIEFPGHAMVALTAYPEFGTTGKVPEVKSNISIDLFSPEEKALNFLKDILDETMELFPFEVIHFGGDESPKGQWKDSEKVQAKIKELGLKNENQLQAWMFNELNKHIATKGKKPAGWEEIMHGDNMETLTKDAIIMPWLSMANGIKAANAGHGVLHSQTGTFYLDTYQTDSPAENWTLYGGPLTLERIYNFNLYPDELTEEGKKNILGAQCQLWSELMPKSDNVEYQAFPRLTSLAELTWTPKARKDYNDYYKRLLDHRAVLDSLKLNYRYIDPLPAGHWTPEVLVAPTFTLPLVPDPEARGEMVVQFDYKGGSSGLDIRKVELLSGTQVIAADEHDGFTGSRKESNTYRLKYDQAKAKGKLSLRITHANDKGKADSRGDVTVFAGKGLALFDPRNFARGDHASATWNLTETAKGTANVRIPMDGMVKEAGMYDLIFDLKQSKSPVLAGHIKVQGMGGSGAGSMETASMDDKNKKGYIPFEIKPADLKSGNVISFSLKSSAPSSGEVRLRRAREISASGEGQYAWNPELLAGTGVIGYIRNVTPKTSGKLTVRLDFKSGGNGLDIKGVQILKNGRIIAASDKAGFAGSNSRDNVYVLESPEIKAGQPCVIRLALAGAGGTNSHGIITIE